MWLGLGLRLDQQGAGSSSGGGSGTALSAPTLTRTSGATTYPPLVDFTRPIDWIDGDQAVMQRSQDPTFATGVSEAVQTILAATTTYNFGLSSIASGSWFMRMAAWQGARPASGSLNWSNITNVGDVTAPTITSSATQSSPSVSLTADELVTWAIVGGVDASLWQIVGSTLTAIPPITQSVHTVQVQATDYAGNVSTPPQTITNTIDITPTAFAFTDVTGATASTVYTSNTITVAGLGSGVTTAVSVTGGTYSKNGGAYTSTSGTATNGDTFAVRTTTGSLSGSTVNAALTIGTVSDTYSVSVATLIPQVAALGLRFENNTANMFQSNAGSTAVATAGDVIGYWADLSGNARHLLAQANDTTRPTYRVTGGVNEVQFDGVNDALKAAAPNLYSAGSYTAMIAVRSNSNAVGRLLLSGGEFTTSIESVSIVGSMSSSAANGNSILRDGGGADLVPQTVNHFTNVWDGTNKVIVVVDDGTGIKWYVDGVAGTRQAYSRAGANPFTMNNIGLGAWFRSGGPFTFFSAYVQGVLIWPGLILNSAEIAQATTFGGTLQGRTL